MRTSSLLVLASMLTPFVAGALHQAGAPDTNNVETIMARVQQGTARQDSLLCGYSVTRRYTLSNKHLKHNAEMTVLLTYRRGQGKHFKILNTQYVSGLVRHAMLDLVEAEPRTTGDEKENGEVNEANYRAALLGTDTLNGHVCYHLSLSARKKSRYLIDGQAWVDAREYAVLRLKGRLSASVSFWVGRPYVEQDFAKFGQFWMPSYTKSTAHVKIAGETVLTIQDSGYQFDFCGQKQQQAR